ncbi:MAG TPA: alpha/beta hydrolase [Candidatus Acetothermia bacterium]|nr:alpha/beta hydrolase [Candidatus Bipolaricaulota bacterium]RLE41291.1 MAG: alpha/beta hydrolase [Candidatus Acetothermia bacterium]HDJ29526.1 alpha/beta hydrolase [Candidatus Acetothermia bacterium]
MAFLETKDRARIYYEVHGEGAPILFLNGIMMNTISWAYLVPVISQQFQLILMDFRDQGRSSRMSAEYSLDIHVGDVLALLDELGLPKVHLLGLSYGGQVALKFTLAHQDRLHTLILPNTNNYITNHLSEIGKAWEVAAALNDGEKFFKLAIPFIYSRSFYARALDQLHARQEMFKEMLTKEWFEAFIRLSHSTNNFRVSPEELERITVPTLLIGAEDDIITPVELMRAMHEKIKGSEFVVIPEAGHGAFLEKADEFLTLILGFVTKHSQCRGEQPGTKTGGDARS